MRILFLVLALANLSQVFGQNKMLDSLYLELKNHPKRDTFQVKILNSISYYSYANPAETKKYAELALQLSQELHFEKGIAGAQYMLGIYFLDQKNYQQALDYGLKALGSYEEIKNKKGVYNSHELIAGIYMGWQDYGKAQEYLQALLKLSKEDGALPDYGNLYHNLGVTYIQQKKFSEGLDYFKKSLAIRTERNDWYGQSVSYCDIGQALVDSNQLKEAEPNFYQALSFAEKVNNVAVLSAAHNGLAKIRTGTQLFQKAHIHLDSALYYALQIYDRALLMSAYSNLINLFELEGNHKKALEFERLKKSVSDSIFNEEKARQLAIVQTRYETEKKEQTIKLLERDQRIQALLQNILIAIIFVTIIVAVVAHRIQHYREKKNRELLNLQIDLLTTRQNELTEKYKNAITTIETPKESQDRQLIRKSIEIVEKNISDSQFSVEKMAEEMAMSRGNLHRKLKSVSGFSPSDFIRSVRLKYAANLLSSQVDSVAQVGFTVGFEDQSYFTKCFKKHFGVPPSEFARSVR